MNTFNFLNITLTANIINLWRGEGGWILLRISYRLVSFKKRIIREIKKKVEPEIYRIIERSRAMLFVAHIRKTTKRAIKCFVRRNEGDALSRKKLANKQMWTSAR